MKLLIVFALALATASAGVVLPHDRAVPLRDVPSVFKPQGRITNGQKAAEGQFPYQVGLSFSSSEGSWWCGGSLIGPTWILTAAHCTSGASSVKTYFGSTARKSPKLTHTVSKSSFVQHKLYNDNSLANDISLIKIPAVSYTNYIKKIDLPKMASSYSTYSGQEAIASGWGLTTEDGKVASSLQYTMMKVIDNSVCAKSYSSSEVTKKIICTATPGGSSTCSGDSGGPLASRSTGELIGVTSFVSIKGCTSGAPAGFVRVTAYLDWIKEKTGISY